MRYVSHVHTWLLCSLGFFALGGCSLLSPGNSDFGCPYNPNGVTCLSPREVYALTHNRDTLAGYTDPTKDSGEDSGAKDKEKTKAAAKEGINANDLTQIYRPQHTSGLPFVPVLEPAQVQRTYVAPFVSPAGALVAPGKIFNEVTPRRWRVGEDAVRASAVNAPLRLIQKSGRSTEGGPPLSTTRPDAEGVLNPAPGGKPPVPGQSTSGITGNAP